MLCHALAQSMLHKCILKGSGVLQTGEILVEQKHHEKEIRDMCIYKDGTHLATASVDKTVKLIDTQTLEVLRVYQTDRPANAVALSPIFDQVRSRCHVIPATSNCCIKSCCKGKCNTGMAGQLSDQLPAWSMKSHLSTTVKAATACRCEIALL